MNFARRKDPVLIGFLALSVLLHLLLVLLLPQLTREPEKQEPLFVEVVPPRKPAESRARELDLPRQTPPVQRREQPAKQLAERDQVAKRETAPQGKDPDDQPRVRSQPPQRATGQPPPAAASRSVPASPAESESPPRPLSPRGEFPTATAPPQTPQRAPSLKDLTTLAPATMAKLESAWRRKYREGLQKGDTVWLDTEQDLLISFFKRFKTNIYNVWNYPESARGREEQGTCLLRIVVSRQGTIDDVELLESSGSYALDEEAIRAVRKGTPYGPLPSAYPHEKLNIMAYFRYSLDRTFVYGERP